MEQPKKKGQFPWIALLSILLLLFLFAVADIGGLLKAALEWIRELGPLAVLAFIALYVVSTVFLIPGSILTLGSGVLFGVVWGSVWVSVASVTGATLAFLIGRYIARDWVSKKIAGNKKFSAVDKAIAREGRKIVFLTRLSPVFPFNILNYSLGLTKVSLADYVIASWVGMIPGTVMYVYIGSVVGDIATIGVGERERTMAEWGLYAVGLVATVAVTIYVTRIARRSLNEAVDSKEITSA